MRLSNVKQCPMYLILIYVFSQFSCCFISENFLRCAYAIIIYTKIRKSKMFSLAGPRKTVIVQHYSVRVFCVISLKMSQWMKMVLWVSYHDLIHVLVLLQIVANGFDVSVNEKPFRLIACTTHNTQHTAQHRDKHSISNGGPCCFEFILKKNVERTFEITQAAA